MSARDVDIKGNLLLYNFVAVLLGTEILSAAMQGEELWSSELLSILLYGI
jgi:hypothetical protein